MTPAQAAGLIREVAAGVDTLHLSIDLDALPASVAPGVSAPAAVGIDLALVRAMAIAAAETGKLALVDVVELNPRYDVDERTARRRRPARRRYCERAVGFVYFRALQSVLMLKHENGVFFDLEISTF